MGENDDCLGRGLPGGGGGGRRRMKVKPVGCQAGGFLLEMR